MKLEPLDLKETITKLERKDLNELLRGDRRWRLVLDNMTIEHTTHPNYYVDLERCGSSAAILDWICQVSQKTWADAQDSHDLLWALNFILRPQANYCARAAGVHSRAIRQKIETRIYEIRGYDQ